MPFGEAIEPRSWKGGGARRRSAAASNCCVWELSQPGWWWPGRPGRPGDGMGNTRALEASARRAMLGCSNKSSRQRKEEFDGGLGVPVEADTVHTGWHGESVLASIPRRNPVAGWSPWWLLSGAGNLFFCSVVSISYRDPRFGCVMFFLLDLGGVLLFISSELSKSKRSREISAR